MNNTDQPGGEILLYRTEDGQTRIECRFTEENVWMTQAVMAELFQVTVPTLNEHLKGIYAEGELAGVATIRKFRIVRLEGTRQVAREIEHYNLETILAVGYRVRSARGTAFRQWATARLKEYLVKGFILDDDRLKNPDGRPDYFDEVLERIRDIRSAEKRMYLKVRDIFKLAADYDPTVVETQEFFQNRTETAARVKYAFDKGKILIDELCNPDRTLHIDSKVLEMAEAKAEESESLPVIGTDEGDDEPKQRKLTKVEQAELLRRTVDTVGKVGEPGEGIQKVISVGMLSEGWDAKTVTHIMGLRAFSSQLLCEQVVGRGLRRTSYETKRSPHPVTGDEVELFEAEYVNIFGVPFTFLPHEGENGPLPPPPPKIRIEAVRDKIGFLINWPNIIRIDHVYRPKLELNGARPLVLNATDKIENAEMAAVVAGKPNLAVLTEIDLQALAERFRLQKIIFEVARDIYDQMKPGWHGNKQHLLAQVIRLVEKFITSPKLEINPPLFYQDGANAPSPCRGQ